MTLIEVGSFPKRLLYMLIINGMQLAILILVIVMLSVRLGTYRIIWLEELCINLIAQQKLLP